MISILDTLWQLHNDPDSDASGLASATGLDADEGQAIQLQLLERYLDAGEELAGWKIGMTSGESRDALGPGIRPFGFILRSRSFDDGARVPRSRLYRGGVENELCFFIGSRLGDGANSELAKAALAGLATGFEINQKRLPAGSPAGLRVADNLSNWGIVAGNPVAPDELTSPLPELTVTLGQVTDRQPQPIEVVASAGHMDDHYQSLAILAQRLADFGHELAPGQRVITGAYGKTPFAPGMFYGDFNLGIGQVNFVITDA